MKLARTNTSPLGEPDFKYTQRLWGDHIQGTKEQLRRLGIAAGMAFPGESGGPKHRMQTTDQRGFKIEIEHVRHVGEGIFFAWILFPGRSANPPSRWTDCAPGVTKCSDIYWCDEYIGTAAALAAAGLVRLDQLPGQPGMRKMRVTIWPDGTPQGGATSNHSAAKEPGAKQIERASKDKYRVKVNVSEDEGQRRYNMNQDAKLEWEARLRALPRPAPLIELPDAIGKKVTAKPAPQYRAEGNVIYLMSRAEGRSTQ